MEKPWHSVLLWIKEENQMGLDMFLNKVKKIDDMTLEEILETESYIDYLDRPEKYANDSYRAWCGRDMDGVREDKVDDVRKNIKTMYWDWDKEKKHPYKSISTEAAYWRKANQIHNWFVENIQDGEDDCETYIVSKEQLEELLETATIVLNASKLVDGAVKNGQRLKDGKWEDIIEEGKIIQNYKIAQKLLPTSSGFFFGSEEYDQYYYDDIKYTVKQITKVLKETDFNNEYVYYSSSW